MGEIVRILSAQGEFLAWGAYSPHSQITVRIWSWDERSEIDAEFLRHRLAAAIAAREVIGQEDVNGAVRLVHAESDGIPGLIVDRYADILVIQILSAAAERWRDTLVQLLADLTGLGRIYERSDVEVRRLEGLAERHGPLLGSFASERVQIIEHDLMLWVDIHQGHKTGFYLDQHNNRKRVRAMAQGRQVLDCFSYTGGFALNALAGGAESVLGVDSSAQALEMAASNLALNELPGERLQWLEGDVFQVLRHFRDQGRRFDMIVLDPPKFAPTSAQAQRAARGYKDINLLAFKLLRPNGLLATFSCSGGVDAILFQKIVAGAALDAGVEAQIIEHLSQAGDHPVALNFPEGAYLKGFMVRIKQ